VIRFALVLIAVFVVLGILKVLRLFLAGGSAARRRGAGEAPTGRRSAGAAEGEMIRDPVCGTWIDRRLAVFGRRGGETVPVCSDSCRRRLEAG
jgi:hypothetical protein